MFWEELLLRRRVSDADLTQALAAAFCTAEDAVRLVDNAVAVQGESGNGVQVLVERTPLRGDFRLRVRVYLRSPELERRARQQDSNSVLVQRFCELVGSDCLQSDSSPDSTSWLLVSRGATVTPVRLDSDRLDLDEYILVAEKAARVS